MKSLQFIWIFIWIKYCLHSIISIQESYSACTIKWANTLDICVSDIFKYFTLLIRLNITYITYILQKRQFLNCSHQKNFWGNFLCNFFIQYPSNIFLRIVACNFVWVVILNFGISISCNTMIKVSLFFGTQKHKHM